MAKKSKAQRARAAAAKQNRKDRQAREEAAGIANASEETVEEKEQTLTRAEKRDQKAKLKAQEAAKKESKPKKVRFQFLHDVRAEMKRVTWPTRTDVLRWSGVVVGALVFFGVYVAILDNAVSLGLLQLSGLGR